MVCVSLFVTYSNMTLAQISAKSYRFEARVSLKCVKTLVTA
jgi:hypothetical protein